MDNFCNHCGAPNPAWYTACGTCLADLPAVKGDNMSMNHILTEARNTYMPGDVFAEVQAWRFSLAQWLTDAGVAVPDFRGSDDIRNDYTYEYLMDSGPSISEARYALKVLDRAREIIRAEGLDY